MTASKTLTSRAPSRDGSTARDIVRRRDKGYKTEQKRVLERRKKLDLQTSYANAPQGYAFVPVGTPDLSNRCKDLSRQQAYPVHVVNAKPISKHALNTQKVSHHIHRIGYHFRGEIVEQACGELEYVPHAGKYVKPADLIKRRQESSLSRTLTKYGINMTLSTQTRETLDQVRDAIKELFPRIPEEDLHQIVTHAWEEGTDRVGTNAHMDLPRRVQLAVIARIRHNYTDYDRLLRAFEWAEARKIVEPECLQKIIEWRGENDDQSDDQELEEIVRETIVIDDDDDDEMISGGHEAGEEDAVEFGNISDTSIEITHEIALDDDLGAESMDERSRMFHDRFLPERRTLAQRSDIAKQKIGAAKKRIRDGLPPRISPRLPDDPNRPLASPSGPIPQYPSHVAIGRDPRHSQNQMPYSAPQMPVESYPVTPHHHYYHQYQRPDYHDEDVIVQGQRYLPVPPLSMHVQSEQQYLNRPQETIVGLRPRYDYSNSPLPRTEQRHGTSTGLLPATIQPYAWPVASIEHVYDAGARGGMDYEMNSHIQRRGPPPGAEVVDLTSPPRSQVHAARQETTGTYDRRPQSQAQRIMYREQLPVHGAPAPVQYRVPGTWPNSPTRPPPPADGAPAPTQYYY